MQAIEFLDSSEQEQLQLLKLFFQHNTHLSIDFIMKEMHFGTRLRLQKIIQTINSSNNFDSYHVHLGLFEKSVELSFDKQFSYSLAVRLFLSTSVKALILQEFLHQEYVPTPQFIKLLHVSRATLYRRLSELNQLLRKFNLQIINGRLVGTPTHRLNFFLLFYWSTKRQVIFSHHAQLLDQYRPQIHHLCDSLGLTESFDTQLRLAVTLQIAECLSNSNSQAEPVVPESINQPELAVYLNETYDLLDATAISSTFAPAILMASLTFIHDQNSACFLTWQSICRNRYLIPQLLTEAIFHELNLSVNHSSSLKPTVAQELLFLTNSFYYFYGCNIFNDAIETAFDQNDTILSTNLFTDLYATVQPIVEPIIEQNSLTFDLQSLTIDYCLIFYTVWPINRFSITIGLYSANGPLVLQYLETWLTAFVPYKLTIKIVEPLTVDDIDVIITDLDGQSLNLYNLFQKPVIQLHFIGSITDQNEIIHTLGVQLIHKVFSVSEDLEDK